jgi:hypothetical protein
MADKKMVMAVFRDRVNAEQAFDYLHTLGYRDTDINVLMSDKTRSAFYATSDPDAPRHSAGSLATEGMGIGGAIGTAVGATLAAVAAIGTSIAIPGLGLIVAGPLAAALAGGGAGAVTGGLIGALVGAGMTEQNVDAYNEALRNGGVVIGVHPHNDDDIDTIRDKFEDLGGENVCYC